MSVRTRVRRHAIMAPELEITAFLNLMVILVPFLLISAVFSSMTILELNLPPKSPPKPIDDKPKLERNFELIIRKDQMIVSDTLGGPIRSFRQDPTTNRYDLAAISKLLVSIKEKFPKKQNLTILMEPNISYEILVQAMDTARVFKKNEEGTMVNTELFPIISIGDAPPAEPIQAPSGSQ